MPPKNFQKKLPIPSEPSREFIAILGRESLVGDYGRLLGKRELKNKKNTACRKREGFISTGGGGGGPPSWFPEKGRFG